jgi:hypothetical protein
MKSVKAQAQTGTDEVEYLGQDSGGRAEKNPTSKSKSANPRRVWGTTEESGEDSTEDQSRVSCLGGGVKGGIASAGNGVGDVGVCGHQKGFSDY